MLFAYETAPSGGGGNIWGTVGMFAVLFGLMYLMFIRPQSKRRKEALKMQSELGAGDKVITQGTNNLKDAMPLRPVPASAPSKRTPFG